MEKYSYQYIFGPVPSRRLGISLGVDLIPFKTCSLDCIYCECGGTNNLTLERKKYVPTYMVIEELNHYLNQDPALDFITFSGSGEPTLHSGIGKVVSFIKNNFPNYRVALITNATMFHQPELRDEIKSVDLLLPSLDAASDKVFRAINRPVPGMNVQKLIDGMAEFRKIFSGEIWLEIFIIPGINDSDQELKLMKEAVQKIQPDKIQLNTLDRPGTEGWIVPASREHLEKIASTFDLRCEIIAKFKERRAIPSYRADIEQIILQTIKRRPCTVEDLASMLGLHQNEINKYISNLINEKQIVTEVLGLLFRYGYSKSR